MQALGEVGAVITGSHVVYASDRHGTVYVNKDAVYPHTLITSEVCLAIAEQFVQDDVEVVVAPAIGGVLLSQGVAHQLTQYWIRACVPHGEILGVYAEREEKSILKPDKDVAITVGDQKIVVRAGEELVIKKPAFVIKRGYNKLVAGKRVLVVEDVVTTGGSVKKVIEATRACGGNVVGLGVLCNRGGLTPADVADPPKMFALVNVKLDSWSEAECALKGPCSIGTPINTDVGKGKAFLARKQQG